MTCLRSAAVLLLALTAVPAERAHAAGPPPAKPGDGLMPMSKLAPAKLVPEICTLRYRVSTSSPLCQAYCDQGLGYFYSYVWMEAARSFETATRHDPDCAFAWWGLARSLERYKGDATKALLKAHELRDRAGERERYLIKATMQSKGQLPGVGDQEARAKAAIATVDEMLALYDDDEEGWYLRAQLSGGSGMFGGQASAVPFYKSLLKVNPLHPGANHELLHFYENFRRPALGWVYAENYILSSPGLPHPFHMQAHLATRLGRWTKTADRSARAIELERGYHKYQNVAPKDDWQYAHHLEILLVSLTHDGRFQEARAIKKEAKASGFELWQPNSRLALAERDEAGLKPVLDHFRRRDKQTAAYLGALWALDQGDLPRALAELQVLQLAYRTRKNDRKLELRLWETQGRYLCATGDSAAGLKLLARTVEKTKDDYSHHAWGNGAYYMEAWGVAALACQKYDVAEEAFQEALAHDPGSVRAALGLQVLCERQGRSEEAERFAALARRSWARADSGCLERELAVLRGEGVKSAAMR